MDPLGGLRVGQPVWGFSVKGPEVAGFVVCPGDLLLPLKTCGIRVYSYIYIHIYIDIDIYIYIGFRVWGLGYVYMYIYTYIW